MLQLPELAHPCQFLQVRLLMISFWPWHWTCQVKAVGISFSLVFTSFPHSALSSTTLRLMGSHFSDQVWNPLPLQWKHGILTTWPWGKSQCPIFLIGKAKGLDQILYDSEAGALYYQTLSISFFSWVNHCFSFWEFSYLLSASFLPSLLGFSQSLLRG